MDITQLLIHLAVILGVAVMVALAVVPLWLEGEARKADRARAGVALRSDAQRGHRPAEVRRYARAA